MPPPRPDPYRELFERSADAILIIEDGRFVECNQATVEMLGYERKEDLLRAHPAELSPPTQPDGRSSFEKADEMMALAFERGSHRFEWDHLRVHGEVFPVEVLLTAVQHDEKRVLHVVWRDITDRKRLEAQLRHSQKMEVIGRLAGGVAHDFNNLLVAILGNGELLRAKLQDRADLTEFVDEMLRAGHRGAELVRQLLFFSRSHETPCEVIDLVPVLRDVQRMLERLIGEGVRLAVHAGAHPLPIRSTRCQAEQIIVNLVTNARDAMPKGGTVSVGLERVQLASDSIGAVERLAPGLYALLSVSDSGSGMTPDVVARAFEPFFTTKAVGAGTGLGLSTVYGIAKESGGGVRIDSAPGRGTRVEVYWPLYAGEAVSLPPRDVSPTRDGTERIVLAEDDDHVAKVVQRALVARGYQVERACDGCEALDWVLGQRGTVDLLVTDVVMPRMDGPELVRQLRARGVEVPVLLISGYTKGALDGLQLDDGRHGFLAKPFTATELANKVRELLDRRASSG
ncbi:MAG: response regulator [Polyangiaceae bacterium]|nr:response regulator [Polyangiaceae bacterium]